MTEQQRKWNTELMKCPECSTALKSNHIEFVENGIAQRDVYCPESNTDCTFEATEIWTIAETEEYK
jgi:uncharacterized protein with PIN domain